MSRWLRAVALTVLFGPAMTLALSESALAAPSTKKTTKSEKAIDRPSGSKGNFGPGAPGRVINSTDRRVPSNDPAVGRIYMSNGEVATGWITYFGAILTVGHAVKTNVTYSIEFNVPLSEADGTLNHAHYRDTFDLQIIDHRYQPFTTLPDWAIARAVRPDGESPGQVYRKFLNLAPLSLVTLSPLTAKAPPVEVAVTGYGLDGPSPEWGRGNATKSEYSLTQQTGSGAYVDTSSLYPISNGFCYLADTMPGVSGGPVVFNGTPSAAGINAAESNGNYTYCNSIPVNIAQAIDEPQLVAAMQAFPGKAFNPVIPPQNTIFVTTGSLVIAEDGTVLKPFHFLEKALDASQSLSGTTLVTVAAGSYSDKAYTLNLPRGKNLILAMPVGDVTVYQVE
ncbi:trypsin-like serine protease [Asticcacaulis benevestitus]|uniref:Peptidase S1 domain-containing protein n=1 Tax=Asticcacaulis benevestitus DSM 16100 = ATCC BAA-896 TaxID=1121022 RepID=V4PYL5_9CAUL|nr:trypsin-like serine protease [Asticcacaulis benevestitus]ESQ92534.1 hypothetical protein ABENE_07815 [Asticcacaulis benevestitus DSM 16100 = ATCC BAA-896]